MKTGLALVALAFAASTPAFADESPAPGAPYDWTGFYAGAQVGYGWGRDRIHDESLVSGISDYSDRFGIEGVTGGLHAGYNYQFAPWVIGLEGDIELADVDGDNPGWPFGDNTTAKIRSQGSVRARVGFLYDRALLYATGGLAVADIKTRYFDAPNVDGDSSVEAGWTAGGGIEYALMQNWTARVEYRYAEFGRSTVKTTTTDPNWEEHNDLSEHAVRVGVSYLF